MRIVLSALLGMNLLLTACEAQKSTASSSAASLTVGGPCEGCDWIDIGIPDSIDHIDTSEIWRSEAEIRIEGKVLHSDGITPADEVILYYWHTNKEGIYPQTDLIYPEAARHGSIRGWIKTDTSGYYQLLTSRPGSYPNRDEPSHIHWVIKEPQLEAAYYIDAMVFDDDPLLTSKKRKALENRGGSMVLQPLKANESEIAEKNIVLGLNIPNYPHPKDSLKKSGH